MPDWNDRPAGEIVRSLAWERLCEGRKRLERPFLSLPIGDIHRRRAMDPRRNAYSEKTSGLRSVYLCGWRGSRNWKAVRPRMQLRCGRDNHAAVPGRACCLSTMRIDNPDARLGWGPRLHHRRGVGRWPYSIAGSRQLKATPQSALAAGKGCDSCRGQ